jgi:hypothetical protein
LFYKSDVQAAHEDDDDWGEDVSAEAQAKRLRDLSLQAQSLARSSELEMNDTQRVNLFATFLQVGLCLRELLS